jgi:glycosyltransferase involved in cell wall biosynthesis
LVEAMAMGIPIVATDVGGTTELVRPDEHALIVPPHDVDALARAIAVTLDDSLSTEQRVRRSRQRTAQELSIAHRTEQLVDVYRDVIAKYRDVKSRRS